jgi:putative ABC transport system ATP-binding protein
MGAVSRCAPTPGRKVLGFILGYRGRLMEPTVVCKGLTRIYRQGSTQVRALDGIDLRIPKHDFACLSGPSGSGKTTLLNLIGGLDAPTAGEIWVNGERIDTMDKGRLAELRLHHLGFVFQAYNLIPVLSARENVEFVMQLQGAAAAQRAAKARAILDEVGLGGLDDRRPAELSGGQQQRVAVARAIVSQPALVLADEPTANLDSHTAQNLMDLLRHMNEEHGITFLFSTHDQLVMDYSKRLIRLRDGRIEADERRA